MCRKFLSWAKRPTARQHEHPHSSRRKAGVILLTDDNHFLMVQNYDQKWSFPKGGLEEHETSPAAAARELLEETGITIPLSSLRLYYQYYQQKYYLCRASDVDYDEACIHNKAEITGIGWFCFEHLKDLTVGRPTSQILDNLLMDISRSS